VGDGDHDQDHEQPVASSTDATARDASMALRAAVSLLMSPS
jgi:hypothetical protein